MISVRCVLRDANMLRLLRSCSDLFAPFKFENYKAHIVLLLFWVWNITGTRSCNDARIRRSLIGQIDTSANDVRTYFQLWCVFYIIDHKYQKHR